MKVSLRILISLSVLALLTGVAISQTNVSNKSETDAGPGNASITTALPVLHASTDLPVTINSTSTETPTSITPTTTTSVTIASSTSTSTTAPSTSTPTKPTSTTAATTTTKAQTTTTKPPPSTGGRRFDAPSFFGGIILAFGLLAICYVAFKFYRSRTEHNYHSLQETVHM